MKLILLSLFLIASCAPPPPSIELTIPHKYAKPVPSTDTVGILCPEGMLAKGAMMYFHLNGAPDRLELECFEVRVK